MIGRDPRVLLVVLMFFLAACVVGVPRMQRWLGQLLSRHPEFLAHARPAEYYRSAEFRRWLTGAAIFWLFCGILTLVLSFV